MDVEVTFETPAAEALDLLQLILRLPLQKIASTRNKINERLILEFDKDEKMNFAYPTERHIPTPERGGFAVNMLPPSKG